MREQIIETENKCSTSDVLKEIYKCLFDVQQGDELQQFPDEATVSDEQWIKDRNEARDWILTELKKLEGNEYRLLETQVERLFEINFKHSTQTLYTVAAAVEAQQQILLENKE